MSTPAPPPPPGRNHFERLGPEIRLEIYKYCFNDILQPLLEITVSPTKSDSPWPPYAWHRQLLVERDDPYDSRARACIAILKTCKTFNQEASREFYQMVRPIIRGYDAIGFAEVRSILACYEKYLPPVYPKYRPLPFIACLAIDYFKPGTESRLRSGRLLEEVIALGLISRAQIPLDNTALPMLAMG